MGECPSLSPTRVTSLDSLPPLRDVWSAVDPWVTGDVGVVWAHEGCWGTRGSLGLGGCWGSVGAWGVLGGPQSCGATRGVALTLS